MSLAPSSVFTATKSAANPTFDFAAMPSSIVRVGSTYWCLYTRQTGPASRDIRLASSPSRNGPWADYTANPILSLGSQAWENVDQANNAWLLVEGGTYYLFYDSNEGTNPAAIGVATASAVTGPYAKSASNPILSPGSAGAWDSRRVQEPSVVVVGGTWVMAFMGETTASPTGQSEKCGIATATSAIGPWTKSAHNPVIGFGGAGTFDATGAADPAIFHNAGRYWMLYSGLSGTAGAMPWQLGLAYADAAIGPWTRHSTSAFITVGSAGAFDDEAAWRGSIWIEDGTYSGVYAGMPVNSSDYTLAKGGNFTFAAANVPGVWMDFDYAGSGAPTFDATAGAGDEEALLARMMPQAAVASISDDVTAYVQRIDWRRGASYDHVGAAGPGGCTIILTNPANLFDPDNAASPVAGDRAIGMPVWVGRLRDTGALSGTGTVRGLFGGYVKDWVPTINVAGERVIEVLCEDALGRYRRLPAQVVPALGRSHAVLRGLVLDAVGEATGRRSLAAESGTMPFSAVDASSALAVLEELNQATGTRHHVAPGDTKDDWYAYSTVNRTHKLNATADQALDGDDIHDVAGWRVTNDNLIEVQRAEVEPISLSPDRTEVWRYDGTPFTVTNRVAKTVWATFDDYVVDAAIDTNISSGAITTSLAALGRTAKITIWSSAAESVVGLLRILGKEVRRGDREQVVAGDDSPGRLAGQLIASDFIGQPGAAQGLVDFIVWKFGTPRKRPNLTVVSKSTATHQTIADRDLFDVLDVTIDRLSVAARRVEVVGLAGTLVPGRFYRATYEVQETPNAAALGFFAVNADSVNGPAVIAPF